MSYAALLEEEESQLIGSDVAKRFFRKFSGRAYTLFRPVLHQLFTWRLGIEKPEVVVLDIDTMVMDNDDALEREGVEPTYKKKKGFQPLQVSWGNYIVDAIFRSGSKHSNHGDDVCKIIKRLVALVRARCGEDIPIIVILYTNIGQSPALDERLRQAGCAAYLSAEKIIELAHSRGCRELNHRSFKEFIGSEHLPFKRFGMNGAYYYLMLIAHVLFESYKRDVCEEIIPVTSYPTTFRRKMIDFAVKIIKTGHETIVKVTRGIWDSLAIEVIWERCNYPEPLFMP
jgi:hypothetical protein